MQIESSLFLNKLSEAIREVPVDEALAGLTSCILLLIASTDAPVEAQIKFLQHIFETLTGKLGQARHMLKFGQLPN